MCASIILLNDVDIISCNNHLFSKCKIEVLEVFDHVTAQSFDK